MNRRLPVVLMVAFGLLAVPTMVAAAEPALAATLVPGQEIDVAGTGFPANADVNLAIQRNGSDDGSRTLHTDGAGSFTATIAAGPGRGGRYTLVATSGSAKAVGEIVAVETAGGLANGGVQPTAPATDTASSWPMGRAPSDRSTVTAAAVLVTFFLAFFLLLVHRRERTAREG